MQVALSLRENIVSDTYHHFYHYQSSAQYLWLAETLVALEKYDEAKTAYDAALFQDHQNAEAAKGLTRLASPPCTHHTPQYDKHSLLDAVFCASVGLDVSEASIQHDVAIEDFLRGDYHAVIHKMPHIEGYSNAAFLLGKSYFMLSDFIQAEAALRRAIALSHTLHQAYHTSGASDHIARGKQFMAAEEWDLAIADFSKALDLHKQCDEALELRAAAYRQKGNERAAEADEILLCKRRASVIISSNP